MVNKCAALNCRSRYSGENKDSNITYRSFPLKDQNLLTVWLKNIARKDFVPTKYSRLCSLHFEAVDFKEDSSDQLLRRKRRRQSVKLVNRRLKDGAIPSIFNLTLEGFFDVQQWPYVDRRTGIAFF